MDTLALDSFLTYTIGILVFFVGYFLNKRFAILRDFNIPEPVTGGILASGVVFAIYAFWGLEITFELDTRDRLLAYFFTCIGLSAQFSDLVKGGRPLLILLVLTLLYMCLQNAVGISVAYMVGLDSAVGVIAGSASLVGGHGTAIAWAPELETLGVHGALEIGIASATLGLIMASLIGGPIARYLLNKYGLKGRGDEKPMVGIAYGENGVAKLDHMNFMAVILLLHITMIIGYVANLWFASIGLKLPLFVACLFSGIVLSNTIPKILPNIHWPARTKAMAVVSDFSLSIFLAMSLMSMQLWSIADLAGPLLLILGAQTVIALIYIIYIVFPLMGKDYQAAVISAGYGGFALGATPTAIANMTAVTKSNGPAPYAFIVLPLVAAFFVDIANSFIIRIALTI